MRAWRADQCLRPGEPVSKLDVCAASVARVRAGEIALPSDLGIDDCVRAKDAERSAAVNDRNLAGLEPNDARDRRRL